MIFSVRCLVSYTCSNYERFRCTTCICQKRQSFLSMYVTQATGEENYLSVTLLEPADFVWQINCVCAVICQCKACVVESIVLHKAAINGHLCRVSYVIYMLKLRTLSMHHVYLSKKTEFFEHVCDTSIR